MIGLSDNFEYNEDVFAAKSPVEQSDHGTPAPTSFPPDVTLALTTEHFPKDPSVGFVFGTDAAMCDILLPSLPELAISKRQFAVTFQTKTGAVLLRNLSKQSTKIILGHRLEPIKLESQTTFTKEGVTVRFHRLAIDLDRPWGDDDQSYLYNAFLNRLAKSIPNVAALGLLSATEPSARTSLGVYVSEKVIGSGASAVVYRAMHRQTGDFVAIKRYKAKNSNTPWNEGNISCGLKHRHILTFHTFNFINGGEAELVMEYAVLGSLADLIRGNSLTVTEACTTIKHTFLALQYLHGMGITHRDIKPGNILIMARDPIHAKVADFGLSSKAAHLDTFCGTERYLAPEIHRPPYTPKVDIWSAGVVVMDVWGLLPRQSHDSWAEQIVAHARQASNITAELLGVCLQLDPNKRATAEQCLQLSFFNIESGGKEEGASFVENHLDDVVRRKPLHLPDQQRQELLAPDDGFPPEAFAASKGSIPDTAGCNMQERLDIRQEPLSASKLVWNGEILEPFPPHGGYNPQLEDWGGGGNFVPIVEDIPNFNWNPINVEEWVPGAANNDHSGANERFVVRDTIYHFFDWREKKIAHIPDQAMVNVTHMAATAGLRFCEVRNKRLLEMTKDKKRVILGHNRIRGTYMPYSNAIDPVNYWVEL
ncbi:hypothetical protein G3M48_007384 [Beauveria asiatica]|uniref:non-specific serine/threonine protein kinase n=1 Tax=Beauveria asiatica TaxID=1069075 RepID=A0AAW0RMN5_9HYPO